MKTFCCLLICCLFFACGCAVSKNFTPQTKYAPEQLQQDYEVFKNILQQEHPGLYWYTPKDSMDLYFKQGENFLKDSLTETKFRIVLGYVIAKIHCGHTSVRASKMFERLPDSVRMKPFPLSIKFWPDTAIITGNLNRKDSVVTRGCILTSIDGRPMQQIIDSLFQYLPADGYNLTHKYQTLSNRGMFSSLYTSIFSYKPKYAVTFIDTLGNTHAATVSLYTPAKDTTAHARRLPPTKPSRRQRKKMELESERSLRIDTTLQTAFMDLNSFTKDARLHKFFKTSFKKIKKKGTQNLVIDLRGNGGGSVTNSNLLARYITQKPFKVGDSLFAVTRNSRYGGYEENRFFNWLFLLTMTHKKSDGYYHFKYYEKKHFNPKKKNHYNGKVYILTGGNTFSASTLFIQSIKKQDNVIVVGEETGGGAYGNNAWLIPDVTLPNTKVRFRLPIFRLVIDKCATKGWGVQPEVPALPTVNAIRRNADYKTEKVVELIKEANQ